MYIELDDFYAERLRELAEHDKEPNATAVLRLLIRKASKESGLWPQPHPISNGTKIVPLEEAGR